MLSQSAAALVGYLTGNEWEFLLDPDGRPHRLREIRKKLEFPLKSGDAIVQFFGAPYETVDVMVAPAP